MANQITSQARFILTAVLVSLQQLRLTISFVARRIQRAPNPFVASLAPTRIYPPISTPRLQFTLPQPPLAWPISSLNGRNLHANPMVHSSPRMAETYMRVRFCIPGSICTDVCLRGLNFRRSHTPICVCVVEGQTRLLPCMLKMTRMQLVMNKSSSCSKGRNVSQYLELRYDLITTCKDTY